MSDSRPTQTPVKRRGPKGRVGSDAFLTLLVRLDREGATQPEACEALGVSRATYYWAMRRVKQIKAEAMRGRPE